MFAWTVTTTMQKLFRRQAGVMPALLVSAVLMGREITSVTELADEHPSLNGSVVHTSAGRITFVSLRLAADFAPSYGWHPIPGVDVDAIAEQLERVGVLLNARRGAH